MSDCILCGGASGGSEYAICAECCEANASSEREILKTEKRSGAFAFAFGIVALLSFAAGLACGWFIW